MQKKMLKGKYFVQIFRSIKFLPSIKTKQTTCYHNTWVKTRGTQLLDLILHLGKNTVNISLSFMLTIFMQHLGNVTFAELREILIVSTIS